MSDIDPNAPLNNGATGALAPGALDPGTGGQVVASDPTISVWVSANAGTGKTQVLIERILRLLVTGTGAERILCLTFTKAAAAEMAERLHGRLGQWAVMDDAALAKKLCDLLHREADTDELRRARGLFGRVLDVPGGLKIRTIHSFCESLLGRFPLEAGLAPHFSVIDERTASERLHNARDHMLAEAFDGRAPHLASALQTLAALVDENAFADIMAELASKRSKLQHLIAKHGSFDGVLNSVRTGLGLNADDMQTDVKAEACALGAFDELGLKRAIGALQDGGKTDKANAEAIGAWLAMDDDQRANDFANYANVYLTQSGTMRAERGLMSKAVKESHPELLDVILTEQARIYAAHNKIKAIAMVHATHALLRLGHGLIEAFEKIKRDHALLDYDDLILRARDLLMNGSAWVHYKLDGGIDHILVDEAQDTSAAQWDVISALAAEFFTGEGASEHIRTVFAVGDEKQSIYSFQGADPAAFEKMRQHFASHATQAARAFCAVDLVKSYRSTATVLNAVDAVFATPLAADGLTFGNKLLRHFSSRTGQAGRIELWDTSKPEDEPDALPWDAPLDQMSAMSPPARLAARIADTIKTWLDTKEPLPSQGRPIQPGDIMILVRTRSNFAEEMVRALKTRQIPVAGSDRMVLTEQMAVMDLMALGRFALLPQDDLSLAEVLKSPLVGFDDGQLLDLAATRDGTLWQALQSRQHDNDAFGEAYRFLHYALERADFTPPFEFYAQLLSAIGGREKLLRRLGLDATDPLDEFLALALEFERTHVPSLQGFLHWIDSGETQIKRDMELGGQQVRVMTVHGAKGLQSNIVFLPDTCKLPSGKSDARLLWHDDANTVLWPVTRDGEEATAEGLREQLRHERDQEYRRLLYVALTRARDRLYIAGFETKRNKDGSGGRDEGCWYDLIASFVKNRGQDITLFDNSAGWRIDDAQNSDIEKRTSPQLHDADISSPPDWLHTQPMTEPHPPKPLAPSRTGHEQPPASPPFGAENSGLFMRGQRMHKLLQVLPDITERDERMQRAKAYLATPAFELAPDAQAEMIDEVFAVLDHPELQNLFGPDSRAEVPLVAELEGRVVSARLDRLWIDAHAVHVIDYKTNRSAPATVEEVSEMYLAQMANYRAALRRIYPTQTIHCHLLWTIDARLMTLPDSLLDPFSPGAPLA